MRPYTRADAEHDIDAALAQGDTDSALLAASALDRMDPHPTPTLAGAALWYAQQGLRVFPLMPGVKVPFPRSRGVKDASRDEPQVIRWWAAHPTANIGIATGHLFDVIDVDGPLGNLTLASELLDQPTADDPYHGLPVVGVVSTPRPGGRHLYVPATGRGNTATADHIDYRGVGGYVVAPPSQLDVRNDQHPGTYTWVRPLQVEP